ncbi:hypothetical protein O0L34_g513 [Tuta absoluta]|nr:hypothetical protein O0L34_g513 [Tuta absoluta]
MCPGAQTVREQAVGGRSAAWESGGDARLETSGRRRRLERGVSRERPAGHCSRAGPHSYRGESDFHAGNAIVTGAAVSPAAAQQLSYTRLHAALSYSYGACCRPPAAVRRRPPHARRSTYQRVPSPPTYTQRHPAFYEGNVKLHSSRFYAEYL